MTDKIYIPLITEIKQGKLAADLFGKDKKRVKIFESVMEQTFKLDQQLGLGKNQPLALGVDLLCNDLNNKAVEVILIVFSDQKPLDLIGILNTYQSLVHSK